VFCLISIWPGEHHGDSEDGGEHQIGEELLSEMPLGSDSSDTDMSEEEPNDLEVKSDAIAPVIHGAYPPLASARSIAYARTYVPTYLCSASCALQTYVRNAYCILLEPAGFVGDRQICEVRYCSHNFKYAHAFVIQYGTDKYIRTWVHTIRTYVHEKQ